MNQIKTTEISGDVAISRNVATGGNATVRGGMVVDRNLRVNGWLEAKNIKHPCKGMYVSEDALKATCREPRNGEWALVGQSLPADVWVAYNGRWEPTGGSSTGAEFNVEYYDEEIEDLSQQLLIVNGALQEIRRLAAEASAESTEAHERAAEAVKIVEALVNGNVSEAIDCYREVVDFLETFKDSETLAEVLSELERRIMEVSDGRLLEELSGVDAKLAGKVDAEDGKGLSSNDYTDAEKETMGLLSLEGMPKILPIMGVYESVEAAPKSNGVIAVKGEPGVFVLPEDGSMDEYAEAYVERLKRPGGGTMVRPNGGNLYWCETDRILYRVDESNMWLEPVGDGYEELTAEEAKEIVTNIFND